MRLFGFEIRRVNKVDDECVDVLVKSITMLHVELLSFRDQMNKFDLENFGADDAGPMFGHLENIKKLIEIYESNKFSRPGQCFGLVYHMAELEKNVVEFNKLMGLFNQGKLKINSVEDDIPEEDDVEYYKKRLGGKLLDMWNIMVNLLGKMKAEVDMLDICLHGDLMRICTGVDIAMDYYQQQKRIKKYNGKDRVEYKFSFVHNRESGGKCK